MLALSPVRGRNDFGRYLNQRSLVGDGVEIGTHRGDFALTLLQSWQGRRLYCIDPWVNGYNNGDPASYGDRLDDYKTAVSLLNPFGDRVKIIKDYSEKAVGRFKNDSLDFVYIDGNHDVQFITKDLNIWWPKVRSGGIIAGHDFLCINEHDGGWGRHIQKALLPFADSVNRDVFMVVEPTNQPWSFYLVR